MNKILKENLYVVFPQACAAGKRPKDRDAVQIQALLSTAAQSFNDVSSSLCLPCQIQKVYSLCFAWQETPFDLEGLPPMVCIARNPIRSRRFTHHVLFLFSLRLLPCKMDKTSAMHTGSGDGSGASAADTGSMPSLAFTSAHDVLQNMQQPAASKTAAGNSAAVNAQRWSAATGAMQLAVEEATPQKRKRDKETPSPGRGATAAKVVASIGGVAPRITFSLKG